MPRLQGRTTTSSTTETPINGTAYTEQATALQRALVSTSANDTSAGTGAQQVRVTYFTLAAGVITGPFVEVVTLNGTTAVATVGTAVSLIEKLEVIAVGSGGAAAGTISLTIGADGTGGTIASIAAGDTATRLGHHYVASGKHARIVELALSNGGTTSATVGLRQLPYGATPGVETVIVDALAVTAASGTVALHFDEETNPIVAGPARIRGYVAAGDTGSQSTRIDVGYLES